MESAVHFSLFPVFKLGEDNPEGKGCVRSWSPELGKGGPRFRGVPKVAEQPEAKATKLCLQLRVLKITFSIKISISSEMQPARKIDLNMLVLY